MDLRNLFLLGLCIIPLGCGGDGRPRLVKATGKVTLDGAPLEAAIVAFQPITDEKAKYQRPSNGISSATGEFTIGTYGTIDGIPVGKYRVGVIKREVVGKLPDNYDEENAAAFNLSYKWVTPRDYSDPTTSGIEVEVTSSGIQPATIDMKTNGKPAEIEKTGPQKRALEP